MPPTLPPRDRATTSGCPDVGRGLTPPARALPEATMKRHSKPPRGAIVTTVQTSSAADTNGVPTIERKTLVFFVGTDTGVDPGPLHTAQHFASVAAGAGLAAEVRLAARGARNLGAVSVPPP